jgi:cytochrome c556
MKGCALMRRRIVGAIGALTLAGIALFAGLRAIAAPKVEADTKALMRKKLQHAQAILEGLTLEDLKKVKAGADELNLISLEAQWLTAHSPRYNQLSSEFRVAVDKVASAADNGNLDGATLAYVKVVTSCVDCHQVVRGAEKVVQKLN